jgi:hypothetical protein
VDRRAQNGVDVDLETRARAGNLLIGISRLG